LIKVIFSASSAVSEAAFAFNYAFISADMAFSPAVDA
jgi:hypothetical protein